MNRKHSSELVRMIERFTAQRAYLDRAAAAIRDLPGPILEIGLGKGRTYDHLRVLFPDRGIYAFDADIHAPRDRVPDPDHLFLGDFRDTLPKAAKLLPPAALAHADFGTEDRAHDADQAKWLGPLIDHLMARNGLVISDRKLLVKGWVPLDGPSSAWPYYAWRVVRATG